MLHTQATAYGQDKTVGRLGSVAGPSPVQELQQVHRVSVVAEASSQIKVSLEAAASSNSA